MDNRRRHSKRVFAMLLAIIMCLSQAVTAAADEVSANETVLEESAVPEEALEETEEAAEAVPEETVSEEAAPEEPEEAVSGETVPVEAEPEEAAGDDLVSGIFTYTVNDGKVTITGLSAGTVRTGSLVIPGEIDGKTVTVINDNAFYDYDTFRGGLTIPDSVTTIGKTAFMNCSGFTGNLTIPDSVTTIGTHAFDGCSGFTGNLTIPDNITTIENYAFNYTGFDGNLTIGNSVETIGFCAFNECSKLSGTLTIPNSVKTINKFAFDKCSKISRIVNNSAEPLPVKWFWDNDDTETFCFVSNNGVELRSNTDTFYNGTYERKANPTGVSLNKTELYLTVGSTETLTATVSPDNVYDNRVLWNSSDENVATVSNGVVTAKNRGETVITATTVSGGLTASCNVAVNMYGDLYYVVSENGEVIITGHKDGTGATGSIVIPDYIDGKPVTVISDNAFMNCSSLTGTLTIPNSLVTIGESAFENCTGFNGNLTIGNKVKTISNNAFYNCSGFKGNLTIGQEVKTIGDYAFDNCKNLSGDLIIPDSVTSIGEYVFYECSGLSGNLIIPDSITSIGKYAFGYCSGLCGNLTIPNSVKTIGTCAFYECTGLSGNLTIPDSVTKIGEAAFYKCTGLSGNLTIPDSVTQIDHNAFDNCFNFSRIINHSAVSMAAKWFWDENDTTTKCFKDASGNEIRDRESGEFSTGIYERKLNILTGVSLNKTSLELGIGTSETLEAILSPVNTYWDKVSWSTSDETVATVSNGVVTGLKPGNTVITVTTVSGGLSASCNVTVLDKKKIPVTGVTLDKSALSMYPAETEDLTATVAPSDATNKSVSWFSSDEKVATVDNGKVTSVSPGSAVITVSTNDGNFSASCNVTVYAKTTTHKVIFKDGENVLDTRFVENGKPVAEPDSPSKNGFIFIGWSDGTSIWNFTTPVNKDLTLIAKYKAEQAVVSENTGSGMDPTPVVDEPEKKGEKTAYKLYLVKGQTFAAGGKGWTTADKKVANVAAKTGKITAKSKGTATVTNETTEYTVYVAAPAISKESKTVTVLVGQSAEVGIDLQAVDGTAAKYPITWYSANPKVAVVNGGMVTGVAKGSAKVTAYIGGMAYSATVKVIDTCKAPSKITGDKAEFSMNPLQSFNVKFDNSVLTVKKAVWSGDGMAEVKNKSGNVTGYENKVINITTSGKFTAIGPGTTTVTGKDDSSRTVTVTVTVVPVSTKGIAYITKGKTDTIKFPKVTNKKADWWKSSNEKAATVDTSKKDGKVKGIDYGTSDISCLYKGFTFNTPVYVEDPGMVFGGKEVKNKEKLEMKVGEMKQLKINKTYQTLNFKSSKQANAFVDENGFVYARKKGKANISTKINGTTYQIAITVTE